MVLRSLENLENLKKSGILILVRENLENLEKSGIFVKKKDPKFLSTILHILIAAYFSCSCPLLVVATFILVIIAIAYRAL